MFQKYTDQLIWCFTDYDEATNEASIKEFEEKQDRILWEIDVHEKDIKWYCPIVWDKLRTGQLNMVGFVWTIYNSPHPDCEELDENFRDEFFSYWDENKTEDELLDLMLLEKIPIFDFGSPNSRSGCSEAIIIHPKESIKKNPLVEDINWWRTLNTYNEYSKEPLPSVIEELIKKIPCPNCPGGNGHKILI